MNRLHFTFLALYLLLNACQKPLFTDDGTDNPNDASADWDIVNYESERPILNMFATPFQLYAITENEFARFGYENELIEKRTLPVYNGVKGNPALSDNIFMRLTTTATASQTIEFHLTKNPTEVIKFVADSLKNSTDNHLEIDFLARRLGAFKEDGTQFLLPAKIFSNQSNHYVFFLFGFQLNPAHDEFVSVEIQHRIDVPELSADFGNIVNLKFIDGYYYVSTKEGAFRITPDGEYDRIFPQWMLDFFPYSGNIYVTGINTFDLHESVDNGETWLRRNQNSELKMVEAVGEHLFTHVVEGHVFKWVDDDLLSFRAIDFHSNIDTDNLSNFYALAFFNNNYYFNVGREIYFTEEIVAK